MQRIIEHPELGKVTVRKNPRSRRISIRVNPRRGVTVTIPWYCSYRRAEAFLTEHGITEDNIEELSDEWDREYGMSDFWPQEYQSVYGLHRLTEDSWDYYETL